MTVVAATPIEAVLSALGEYQTAGDGKWKGPCQAHDDRVASLSIATTSDGTVLLKCHAGCPTKAIVAALGLQMRDLFPAKVNGKAATNGHGHGKKHHGTPTGNGHAKKVHKDLSKAVNAAAYGLKMSCKDQYQDDKTKLEIFTPPWHYHDAAGKIVASVVRWDIYRDGAKVGKEFRPVHAVDGGWQTGDPDWPWPIYGLPSVLAADKAVPVCVPEGEGCADKLRKLGFVATTSAHGHVAAQN